MTSTIAILALFLPLAGAAAAMPAARLFGARAAEIAASASVALAAILSVMLFMRTNFGGETADIHLMTWIAMEGFSVSWGIQLDALTGLMFFTVSFVSAVVHIYSIGYMHEDPSRPRFFAYLSLFTFMMLLLVAAPNFLQLFVGWEGVGLASYLLIGFWHQRSAPNDAAIKAFVVNRVGDAGLLLGMAAIVMIFGTLDYDAVFQAVPRMGDQTIALPGGMEVGALNLIGCLLLVGAMGKSAQFLLHTWLPDAMEGPTPVSALIHAATMVTAGVFLIARAAPLYEYAPQAALATAFVGGATAFFAASAALVQNDIKRVIAWSTCSQLGYMFAALGLGLYQAALFHLFTHAFFKALLFLGAGSVIHALHDEQDMRRMGGLFKTLPLTWMAMLIGSLSLTGFPLTAGYFSKDAIIEAAAVSSVGTAPLIFALLIAAAIGTAFYSWRLIFMTFHGDYRGDAEILRNAHESPPVMLIPLGLLALGAIFAGGVFAPAFLGAGAEHFWGGAFALRADNKMVEAIHDVPLLIKLTPLAAMLLGFAAALYLWRRPGSANRLARQHVLLYRFLLHKWYFDEIYDRLFARGAYGIGRIFQQRGEGLIDGIGPDGMARRVLQMTRGAVKLQSGYLYHYAFLMIVGLVALMSWILLRA